jgi:hypothetical protein
LRLVRSTGTRLEFEIFWLEKPPSPAKVDHYRRIVQAAIATLPE